MSEKVLGPVDFGETAAYVTDRLSATGWSAASGFKGELHIASGGLPWLVNAIGNAAARHAHGNEITQDNIQYAVANDSSLTDIGNRILDDAFAVNWETMRNNRSHYTMLTAMREAIERQEKDPMMDGFTQDEWWRLVEGVVGGGSPNIKTEFCETFNALKILQILVSRGGKQRLVSDLL